jgi:hypothetical protein
MLTRGAGGVDGLSVEDLRCGQHPPMTIGSSLFLIAVGAILKYAVTAHVGAVDLQVVGVILMIVGVVGLVIGLAIMMSARAGARQPPPPPPDAY